MMKKHCRGCFFMIKYRTKCTKKVEMTECVLIKMYNKLNEIYRQKNKEDTGGTQDEKIT